MQTHFSKLNSISFTCMAALLLCAGFSGCEGKSLIDDNPVFAETPPRIRNTNEATETVSLEATPNKSVIRAISHTSTPVLEGNTIVANVDGSPVFVDDLVGSIRISLEDDPGIPEEQKQNILHTQIRGRLDNYLDQEIVLQELRRVIPADRQDMIRDSLREPFAEVLANIKNDNSVQTDDELNIVLARQGMSIDLLRESFMRIQMVNGYLSSAVEVSEDVDRIEMVRYYEDHKEEFTTQDRVRCEEIVIQFAPHGGRTAAEERMAEVIRELQLGTDFAELAVSYSDALSAEKRGDMGWVLEGSLADKNLEQALFQLAPGKMTKVYVREDQFEVYRVKNRENARTTPFPEAQRQIEDKIKNQRRQEGREKALRDLREKATVVTIYDDEK